LAGTIHVSASRSPIACQLRGSSPCRLSQAATVAATCSSLSVAARSRLPRRLPRLDAGSGCSLGGSCYQRRVVAEAVVISHGPARPRDQASNRSTLPRRSCRWPEYRATFSHRSGAPADSAVPARCRLRPGCSPTGRNDVKAGAAAVHPLPTA